MPSNAWWEARGGYANSIERPDFSLPSFLGVLNAGTSWLAPVTVETALSVPAVQAAVSFLSRTLASLPLHTYRQTERGPERLTSKLQKVLHENWNDEQDSFKARQYFWQQVFTGGRGLAWIERNGANIEAIWPMDPTKVTIKREARRTVYIWDDKAYLAADVIDVPFMLKEDGVGHRSPISMGAKAIQLALAMNEYGSQFFAGGGVPPLVLSGPMPANAEAMKRAQQDIQRSIQAARDSNGNAFATPPGYTLSPVGFDPDKGQMVEARRFQVEEIARIYQLPPVFLQDLTHGTFSNTEQQDLHLTKHLVGQWAEALEGQLNLKLFGRLNNNRYAEHNLDGLARGDIKTRMDALARAVQGGIRTPNEARQIEGLPRHDNVAADELFMQGATVPLGTTPQPSAGTPAQSGDNEDAA